MNSEKRRNVRRTKKGFRQRTAQLPSAPDRVFCNKCSSARGNASRLFKACLTPISAYITCTSTTFKQKPEINSSYIPKTQKQNKNRKISTCNYLKNSNCDTIQKTSSIPIKVRAKGTRFLAKIARSSFGYGEKSRVKFKIFKSSSYYRKKKAQNWKSKGKNSKINSW